MDEIEAKVKMVLAKVLDNGLSGDEIHSDGNMVAEFGLDSLQAISFLLGIEDVFVIELDYDELSLDHLSSVREFSRYVAGMVTARA